MWTIKQETVGWYGGRKVKSVLFLHQWIWNMNIHVLKFLRANDYAFFPYMREDSTGKIYRYSRKNNKYYTLNESLVNWVILEIVLCRMSFNATRNSESSIVHIHMANLPVCKVVDSIDICIVELCPKMKQFLAVLLLENSWIFGKMLSDCLTSKDYFWIQYIIITTLCQADSNETVPTATVPSVQPSYLEGRLGLSKWRWPPQLRLRRRFFDLVR